MLVELPGRHCPTSARLCLHGSVARGSAVRQQFQQMAAPPQSQSTGGTCSQSGVWVLAALKQNLGFREPGAVGRGKELTLGETLPSVPLFPSTDTLSQAPSNHGRELFLLLHTPGTWIAALSFRQECQEICIRIRTPQLGPCPGYGWHQAAILLLPSKKLLSPKQSETGQGVQLPPQTHASSKRFQRSFTSYSFSLQSKQSCALGLTFYPHGKTFQPRLKPQPPSGDHIHGRMTLASLPALSLLLHLMRSALISSAMQI